MKFTSPQKTFGMRILIKATRFLKEIFNKILFLAFFCVLEKFLINRNTLIFFRQMLNKQKTIYTTQIKIKFTDFIDELTSFANNLNQKYVKNSKKQITN